MNRPSDEQFQQRLREAADWMIKLRDEDSGEADIIAWSNWCAADPQNQLAFDQAQDIWELTAELKGELVCGVQRPAQPEAAAPPAGGLLSWLLRPASRPWQTAWAGVAAGLVAVAVIGFDPAGLRKTVADQPTMAVTLMGPAAHQKASVAANPAPDYSATEASATGPAGKPMPRTALVHETRFADGSAVELATGSSVSVRYDQKERALQLDQGEAYFKVARDKSRPFVVTAGTVRVRALGTAFNVRRVGSRVVVSVTEGLVDVARQSPGQGEVEPIQVAAGSQLRWGGPDEGPVVLPIRAEDVLGWQQGRLTYTEEPIGAVIADFNRYARRPARITSDAIWHIRFSGTLYTATAEEWLHSLPGIFPVQIIEDDQGYAIVSKTTKGAG